MSSGAGGSDARCKLAPYVFAILCPRYTQAAVQLSHIHALLSRIHALVASGAVVVLLCLCVVFYENL